MTDTVRVPKEPTEAVLLNMAVRNDHGLGCPGYYDQPIFGGEGVGHARRLEAALTTMRQLYEEVVLAASPQGEGSSADALPGDMRKKVAAIRAWAAPLLEQGEDRIWRRAKAIVDEADAILSLIQSERGDG